MLLNLVYAREESQLAGQEFSFHRRRFLASGAVVVATLPLQRAMLAMDFAADAATCKLNAEQEEGPFYIADELFRSNLVEDKPGVPLSLRIVLLDAHSCQPLAHAIVDIWHCDAMGLYSGFTKQNGMGPGGFPAGGPPGGGPPPGFDPEHAGGGPGPEMGPPPKSHPTDKMTFLRGIQRTDSEGAVAFTTVFPGFYMGRTNHIHFKVRTGGEASTKAYGSGHTSHTGQIFFPETVATELMQHAPYSLHTIHRTTQSEDHVFTDQHGGLSIARLQPLQAEHFAAGMHAEVIATVDPAAKPAPVSGMGGRPPMARRKTSG